MCSYQPLNQRSANQTETPFLFSRLLGRKAAVVEQADGTNILWIQSKLSTNMQKIGDEQANRTGYEPILQSFGHGVATVSQ